MKNNKSIILTKLYLDFILLFDDCYFLFQGLLDHIFNREGFFLTDAFMEQIKNWYVELCYLLDNGNHLYKV